MSENNEQDELEHYQSELAETLQSKRQRIFMMILGAALGAIPWIGNFLSGAVNFKSAEDQVKTNKLYEEWLAEHARKMAELRETLTIVLKRLDEFPVEINARLQSEEYLGIVRKAFRLWDTSDTVDKKEIIRKLITNAGAYELVSDDIIRLFLDWIDTYHEIHFAVIKEIYQSAAITRHGIWTKLNGASVREDSMEADVFKMLIRDLSMGGVIRQHRETTAWGEYVKKTPVKRKSTLPNSKSTYKSAFDNEEYYELTQLGKQFVHYTMNEVVTRVGSSDGVEE